MSEQPKNAAEEKRGSIGEILTDPIGAFLQRYAIKPPSEPTLVVLEDADPKRRAEKLGALYAAAKKLLAEKRTTPLAKEDALILETMAELYADADTRRAYLDYWRQFKSERKTVNGSYDQYRRLRDDIDALEQAYDESSRALFNRRGQRTTEMEKILFQRTQRNLKKKRAERLALVDGSPKLAAQVSYDVICRYSDEYYLSKDPFMMFPSRREILEKLEEASQSGRPVRIVGESGTGKTEFVKATARNLTGRKPFKFQGGPTMRLRDILGYRDDVDGRNCIRYKELAEAITGKQTSLDQEPIHDGGVVFGDEFTNFPTEVQLEIVKAVSNAMPGADIHVPFIGDITVAKNYLFVVADNLASDRYDRKPMDPAAAREFGAPVTLNYIKQTFDEPELFEGMLAAVMDVNHRPRFAKSELAPPVEYEGKKEKGKLKTIMVKQADGKTAEKQVVERIFFADPKAGGFLWRFAGAMNEIYKSYSHQDTVLKSKGVGQYFSPDFRIIDPGIVFGWLRQAAEQGYEGSLESWIVRKLNDELGKDSGRSDVDAKLAEEFFAHFNIFYAPSALAQAESEPRPRIENLTPEDIGLLSPRVKYLEAEPIIKTTTATAIIGGRMMEFSKTAPPEAPIGMRRTEVSGSGSRPKRIVWEVRGTHEDKLIIAKEGAGERDRLIARDEFLQWNEDDEQRQAREEAEKLLQEAKNFPAAKVEEQQAMLERAIEFLGRDNVHGPDDVRLLLGFAPKEVPPIPYTLADFMKSKEIEQKTGVKEMLVLFANDRDGSPLTGEKLNQLIQAKYTEMGLGKFLIVVGWYKNEKFFKELGLTYEWKLVTKQCIPDSYGRRHHFETGDRYRHEDTQEHAIERFALEVGIPREKLKRPKPFAMIYAIALHLVATEQRKGQGRGERLLEAKWHWSDVNSSGGNFVGVGYANQGGAYVGGRSRNHWEDADLGVCLSR